MGVELPYQLFADLVLTVHVVFVLFVVGGLVLVIVGNCRNCRKWPWVDGFWLRVVHLGAIVPLQGHDIGGHEKQHGCS